MANVSAFSGAQPITPGGLVELGYSQITSIASVTSSTLGAGTQVIAPLTVVCDGGPILIEFYTPRVQIKTAAGSSITITLNQNGSELIRTLALVQSSATATTNPHVPVMAVARITPSAGTHTFSISAVTSGGPGSCFVYAGTGTTDNAPAFLRVSKIVNQNDGLKPFWTPPVVTQLPSQATVGDQVIYAADATNGVYWNLYYDGLGTYPWKFIGGSSLYDYVAPGLESVASGTYTDLATLGPSVTTPLAGDYFVAIGAGYMQSPATTAYAYMSYAVGGTAASDADSVMLSPFAGGNHVMSAHGERRKAGIAASTLIRAKYRRDVSNANFDRRYMRVTPIRVSA